MESNRLQRPVSRRRYDNHARSPVTVLFSLAAHEVSAHAMSASRHDGPCEERTARIDGEITECPL